MIFRRFCLILVTLVLGLAPAARAGEMQGQVRAMVDAADLRQTQVSILIADLASGKRLAQLNPDEPRMPASNMKLLTTAAAVKILGPDFVFRTELRLIEPADGPAPQKPSTAAGPRGATLLIHGDGDPGLADPELLQAHNMDVEQLLQIWVKAVQDAKVQRVERLIVDDRVFDHQFVHPSWPADQLSAWYCAQVAGINFFDNCIDVYAEPTVRGQGAKVRLLPAAPFLVTVNRTVTGNLDRFLVTRKPGGNELTFSGEVKTRRTQSANVTIDDPPMFFAGVLANRLAQAGIPVDSIARPGADETLPAGKTIQAIENTLPLIIQRCNKDSQNLFAESLLKRMGRAVTGAPGSWDNGAAAVRLFLRDQLGTQAAAVSIADGSGMSRDNRLTAGVMVNLLTAMHNDPKLWPVYRDSLSMDHSDGTLKKRFRNVSQKLSGELYPKTGYIHGVCTLSGYLVAPDSKGERAVVFSLLFNDLKAPVGQIQALQDNLLRLMDRHLGAIPAAASTRAGN